MPQPKFQLYKHIKISGKWRYCRAAIYSNGKVKPHVVSWSVDRKRSTKKALVRTCKKACVEDVSKQDMIDFMGWLRRLRRNFPEGVRREPSAQEKGISPLPQEEGRSSPRRRIVPALRARR